MKRAFASGASTLHRNVPASELRAATHNSLENRMRYRAFISYSHKDSRWATWLTRNLEGYRVPARLRGSSGEFGPLPDRLRVIYPVLCCAHPCCCSVEKH